MIDYRLIQIQTTSVCNASCIMCPYKDSWFKKNPGVMSEQLFDKILRNIKKEDPEFDGLFCPYLMNEPFADKKMLDRIEKIYKIFPNATIEVSTNAELLNSEKIDRLVDIFSKHRSKLVFSHHGIDEKSFEKNMGINYDRSLHNIIEAINKANGRFGIAIQDMAMSQDGKYKIVQPRIIQRYWKKIFEEQELSWDNVWLSTMQFHNRAGNVKLEGWDYNRIIRKIDKEHMFSCYRANDDCLHITYDGDVVLCCMDYHKETVFGNMKKQNIEEIFFSDEFEKIYGQVRGTVESPDDFICCRCSSPGG